MSVDLVVVLVVAVITASPGVLALVINRRKQSAESRQIDTDTSRIQADITARYQAMLADAVNKLDAQSRMNMFEQSQQAMQKDFDLKIRVMQAEVEKQTKRADKFEDWARRLVAQLESMSYIPVPLEPSKKPGMG
jgi:hypothetical protein